MNRKQLKKRPKVVYNTPGQECQHADRGACPSCILGPRLYRRFHSRQVMPAARTQVPVLMVTNTVDGL